MKKILNIAAGKMPYLSDLISDPYEGKFVVNLDTMYYQAHSPDLIEENYNKLEPTKTEKYYCNEDIFTFLERTKMLFNIITMYRFLEHVPFDRVLYFIYLISTSLEPNGTVDVIVPNYIKLANMILDDNPGSPNFEAHNILLTTELLNEPGCPHASIWTYQRAKYFWELEKRFTINSISSNFTYDGRNIYLRFQAVKK